MRLKPSRLYEQVVEHVSSDIFHGRLKAGDQLPNERALAESFGVSRTVIREAMKTLAKDGLIEVRTGLGTFVVDGTSSALRSTFENLMKFGDDADRLRELVELREIMEPGVAGLAARRADADNIQRLDAAYADMEEAMDDAQAFIEADNRFHQELAQASQNRLIPLILESVVDILHELRGEIFQIEGGPQRGQSHHKTILAAIRNRDATAAHHAMEDHLAQVKRDTEAAARKRRQTTGTAHEEAST